MAPQGWGKGPSPVYHGAPLPPNNAGALAKHAYQQAQAALSRQKSSTLNYYGFTGKGRVDPSNPYGAYQMQQREQGTQMNTLYNAQAQAGLTGGAGIGGGGMRGLGMQQRNLALHAQGFEQTRLLKEFQDKMDAIRLGKREARWARRHDKQSGVLQAIMSAITAGQFTPAAPVQGGGY